MQNATNKTTTPKASTNTTGRAAYTTAKANNFGLAVNSKKVSAAVLTKSSKGTNAKRNRLYGYDNGANGGPVPVLATMVLVPGATANNGGQKALVAFIKATTKPTAQGGYSAKVFTSRTVRRAYRAGLIRFNQQ